MRLSFNDQALCYMAETHPAEKEGCLMYRKNSKSHKKYKERWFKLHANLLFYFKLNESGHVNAQEPIGVLVLVGSSVRMESIEDQPFVFSVSFCTDVNKGTTAKYLFCGQSLEHCIGWIDAIERAATLRAQLIGLRQRIERITGRDPMVRRRDKGSSVPLIIVSNPDTSTADELVPSMAEVTGKNSNAG